MNLSQVAESSVFDLADAIVAKIEFFKICLVSEDLAAQSCQLVVVDVELEKICEVSERVVVELINSVFGKIKNREARTITKKSSWNIRDEIVAKEHDLDASTVGEWRQMSQSDSI